MLPSKQQWKRWSLPSKLTAVGAYVGILALALSVLFFVISPQDRGRITTQSSSLGTDKSVERIEKTSDHLGEVLKVADGLIKSYARQSLDEEQINTLVSVLEYRAQNITDQLSLVKDDPEKVKTLEAFKRLHSLHINVLKEKKLVLAHEINTEITNLLASLKIDKPWVRYWFIPEP